MGTTFNERYDYWEKMHQDIKIEENPKCDINFDEIVTKNDVETEKAKEDAIAEISNMYGVEKSDVDFQIMQEAKKGLFRKKAIVSATLKQEKKNELFEAAKRKALEEANAKNAQINEEKEIFQKELSSEFISKLKDIVQYFPELLFSNMRSLHFNVLNYCADQGKYISDLNCILDDVLHVWYLCSSSDIDENFSQCVDVMLTDLLLKYESDKVLKCKDNEYEGMGRYLNYKCWVAGLVSNKADYVANRVLPLSCGVSNDLDEREESLLSNARNFVEFDSNSLVENRELIIGKYLENLYIIPMVWNDLQKAKTLLECEELLNIINNNSDGALVVGEMAEVYNIYKSYYSNIWTDLLTEPQFRNIANMALLIKDREDNLRKYDNLIISQGTNASDILRNAMKEKDEGMSFFYYFLEYVMEQGKIDNIIGHEEYERFFNVLMYCLCDHLYEYYDDIELWIRELIQALAAMEKVDVYRNKYVLLHPNMEKKNAAAEIRTQLNSAVTGEDFEVVLKLIYEQLGYEVSLTKTTGDQGADLVMQKNGTKVVVQAKYYSSPVGNSAVQEVVGALNYYGAQKAIVVTNNSFTNAAVDLARVNNVQLVDGRGLETLIDSIV